MIADAEPARFTSGSPSFTGPPVGSGADSQANMGEVIVTAQRHEEASSKVAMAITAYGKEQLAQRSITTERDLQSSVPGLVVRTVSSESQLTYSIRGQSVDPFSGVSPAVLAFTNDVEANTGAPGSFYDLSSVQVVKGPQGTLLCAAIPNRNTTVTTRATGRTLQRHFESARPASDATLTSYTTAGDTIRLQQEQG